MLDEERFPDRRGVREDDSRDGNETGEEDHEVKEAPSLRNRRRDRKGDLFVINAALKHHLEDSLTHPKEWDGIGGRGRRLERHGRGFGAMRVG